VRWLEAGGARKVTMKVAAGKAVLRCAFRPAAAGGQAWEEASAQVAAGGDHTHTLDVSEAGVLHVCADNTAAWWSEATVHLTITDA
jgi:hypothetical protein